MIKVKYQVWNYDFRENGGYGWIVVDEKILTISLDQLILDIIHKFDNDYIHEIWHCAEYDNKGNLSGFIFHHKGIPTEYVYKIIENG